MRSLWRHRSLLLVAVLLPAAYLWGRGHLAPGTRLFRQDLRPSQLTVPARTGRGPHAFLETGTDGKPVRFDPCRRIHYRVYVGRGPLNGLQLVEVAVAQLSAATGLQFVYDGEAPSVLASTRTERATDPVWIGWAAADETTAYDESPGASSDTVGVGGPLSVRASGKPLRYVGGSVILKPSRTLRAGFGPGESEGNVLLHELGHLVGLAHVSDTTQLMNPATGPMQNGYSAGDLEGLYELGAAPGCL